MPKDLIHTIGHSDHSIPSEVDYDTYEFFRTRALEMGTY